VNKPFGRLRYIVTLPGAGAFGLLDPFTDPDDFGNVINPVGGIPQVPAYFPISPLVRSGGGNFGFVTIFPASIVMDPVTGNTLDVVLQIQNDSPAPGDFLTFFLTFIVPPRSNEAL